jgi:hypothetical protein
MASRLGLLLVVLAAIPLLAAVLFGIPIATERITTIFTGTVVP